MKKNSHIDIRSDSEDIRIYIDETLHIRFPRDKNIHIQSWIDKHSKLHSIEIQSKNKRSLIQYESRDIWIRVLKLLDSHI